MTIKKKKHEQSKYFTLMLVPSSTKKTLSFRIPHFIFHIIVLIFSFTLIFFLFSYIRVNYFKNLADATNNALEFSIEENSQLEEEKKRINDNIKNQKENYQKQLNEYENQLKYYEEKAVDLEKKIEDLDKAKTKIFNLLSEKVGDDLIASSNSTSNSTFKNLAFIQTNTNNKNLALSTINFLSPTSKVLDTTYTNLETRLDSEMAEYDKLVSQVEKFKPYIDAMPTIWPVKGYVTSAFGYRSNPFTGTSSEYHAGLDIKASTGTPIKVTGAGSVVFAGWQNGYGNFVIVDHGYGIQTCYGHNSKLAVSVGDKVSRGDVIAYAGSTGRSTGSHCHYEVRVNNVATNPRNYITN